MTHSPSFTTDDLVLGSTPRQIAPGRFVWTVPDEWQQGRGAFGGLVLAAITRAIEASEPDKERVLRSFNGEIAGPVLAEEAEIEVTELRRGSGLSAFNAVVKQRGQAVVRGSALLAKRRSDSAPSLHMAPPERPPWTEVPVLAIEMAPFAPIFAKHIEFRVTGPLPFSGASEPTAAGWIRLKRPPSEIGAPEIVALADAFWPSGLASQPLPRPVGTVAFGLQHLVSEQRLDPSIPFYYRGKTLADQDGFLIEMRELWTADGRLLALNQQTLAWIR